MRTLILAVAVIALGCDRLQKPESPAETEKDEREGTADAAKEYAKKVVLQRLGAKDAKFGLLMEAKQTAVEVNDVWWEISGSITMRNAAGKSERQEFTVTAVKPINSNRWKWILCRIGEKTHNNAPAG